MSEDWQQRLLEEKEQLDRKIGPQETGAAGNQNSHNRIPYPFRNNDIPSSQYICLTAFFSNGIHSTHCDSVISFGIGQPATDRGPEEVDLFEI